jgi:hypothetical protein
VLSVADLLEREVEATIKEWLRRVHLVPELTDVRLSDADRTDHLPQLFDDVLWRLRVTRDGPNRVSFAAAAHGSVRFEQGYSPSMLVEESRIFQVSTFCTLHLHQSELPQSELLLDVITIADEADRQLTETMHSFMIVRDAT